jgi:NADH-quinone oxidoreductase subunit K
VVVYAGAVMVLYVFVAAYVGAVEEPIWEPIPGQRFLAPLLAVALFVELSIAILGSGLSALGTDGPELRFGFGGPEQIGQALLTRFLVAFEVASFLLLIAAVGAVVLARRRGGVHEEETRVSAMAFLRPPGVGTMAEAVEGRTGTPEHRELGPPAERVLAMSVEWFLVVSALVFCIGAGGVLTRRNPLVVLLCLELMLNAANIALIAFARMWGNVDGQIFAIIVMVVAACEVCIGLGLVVAIYRRRLPIDVDELRELQG